MAGGDESVELTPESPVPVPEPERKAHQTTVLCEECGTIITVKNVEAFVLGVHLAYGCQGTAGTLHE